MAVTQHAVSQQAFSLRVASGLHLPSDLRHRVQHVQFGSGGCGGKQIIPHTGFIEPVVLVDTVTLPKYHMVQLFVYLGSAGGILLFWTRDQTQTCWSPQFSKRSRTRTLTKYLYSFTCKYVLVLQGV